MKKLVALLLAMAMVLTLLAGCGGGNDTPSGGNEAGDPKVVSLYYGGGTPLSIDPALNSASSGSNVLKLAHTGLMGWQYDASGNPVLSPELAESYTVSDDGMTYTFTLREGLKWSDGQDFKASQIVYSWNRAASADLGADYGYMFEIIDGYGTDALNISADDAARTFTATLISPAPYFLELCAFPTYYPVREDIVDNEGIWATKADTYVGMGAFRMSDYRVDDVITFEKNPNYWNANSVILDGVNCYLSEDNVAILTAYENGDAQFINSIDPTEYERIRSTYGDEFVIGDYIGTYYVLFNVYKDLSPLGKQLTVQEQSKTRQALGMMVNRVELVEDVTQGGQLPATGFFPAGLGDGLNTDVRTAAGYGSWYTGTDTPAAENSKYTQDQVDACKMLIDLGYAYTGSIEGGDIKFTDMPSIDFAFNNSGANALIIQYIQETWNTFGISSTINTEAWATLQVKLKEGNAEAARMGWIADFNHVINFLDIFVSASGNNYPRLGRDIGTYTNASDVTKDAGTGAYWGLNGNQTWADAYDALSSAIKLESDPAKAAAMAAEAEEVLMASGGAAPLYFYTNPYMLDSSVQDVIMLSTGDVIWTYADIVAE